MKEHVPLAPLTTFGIGGPARYLYEVRSEHDVRDALIWARGKGTPHVVLAGCSNVLIPDEGLDALVIKMANDHFQFRGTKLEAEAGCTLLTLIRAGSLLGVGRWEKLAGIPGTLGGAIRGNAGAFGPEIKDFVTSVMALNAHTLETRTFTREECAFAYRMSFFKMHPEWIILSAHLTFGFVEGKESLRAVEDTIAERERRHIQNVRAAGSYFMNPVAPSAVRELFEKEKNTVAREGRVPAGWLIEKAGLKGAREGDAEASVQHPNYLKNNGKANARDVKVLAARIKKAVKEQFDVELIEEAAVW